MYPTIVQIGSFKITSFGVMMFFSFIAGAWILAKQFERRNIAPGIAWDMLAWLALGGIVGAKLYYVALHMQDLVQNPLGELTNRGGLVWYGGFIGGSLAFMWQARRHKLLLGAAFDSTAPAIALAYAVGRMGCFLVGDDYGLPTNSWVGIAFPDGSPPSSAGYLRSVGATIPASIPDNVIMRVHPTQLYEIAAALVIFWILWKLSEEPRRPWAMFGAYMGLYGIERFLVEFVRAKGDRYFFGLSTSQVASLVVMLAGTYLWTRRHGPPLPSEVSAGTARRPRPKEKPAPAAPAHRR
jgi:phosphatidylglycerol:prolipoprotein diacylglycerol transferase